MDEYQGRWGVGERYGRMGDGRMGDGRKGVVVPKAISRCSLDRRLGGNPPLHSSYSEVWWILVYQCVVYTVYRPLSSI